ncbi:MAG: hypothetical protein JF597_51160, partial [Streptomyces sp.]|nr:hypothetical protein [Streptomyces sp.]
MLAIVRRTIHTDAARTPRPGRVAMAVALTALLTFALFPRAGATFTATTGDTGNAFTAAASFPDYPTAVLAANPLAYYRLDDTPGSITAADSSTHGSPGVYGTANYAAWTGLWPMDEGGGATTADLSGNATRHPLTRDGATWTATGRRGSALAFDGTSAYADSGTRVLTTTGSFAVTAWVYLTDTTATRTAVSEDGANISAFELGYAASHWTFGMPRT